VCGRYASARKAEDLAESFGIRPENTHAQLPADYNVAPTKQVYAVLERAPRPAPGEPAAGEAERPAPEPVRQLRAVRWGLVPSWAKDPSIGNRLINARVETVAEKPAYRRAFAARRCILPADGFYEWYAGEHADDSAAGKPRKQPFFIHPADGSPLAMAGLYEFWRDPARDPDDPEAWVVSATVITTTATDEVGRIHERMPMTIAPEHWAAWLDPGRSDPDLVIALLDRAAGGRLDAYPVSTAVNDVRRNGPELLEPLPAV
jgi:putative SOS response-associated peptidase YedK